MSFKRHFHCGNPSLFSGATAVKSRPKFHTSFINLVVFSPTKMAPKTVEGSIYRQNNSPDRFQLYFDESIENFTSFGKHAVIMGDCVKLAHRLH